MINYILKFPKRVKRYYLELILKSLIPIVSQSFKTAKELDIHRSKNEAAYEKYYKIFHQVEKLNLEIMSKKQLEKYHHDEKLSRLKREGKLW